MLGVLLFALLPVLPAPAAVLTDSAVEVLPQPPRGALESGLSGQVAALYAAGIAAIRANRHREALALVRQARALSYRQLLSGPLPRPLARRHFVRIVYVEEQLADLTLLDEQLNHMPSGREEERASLLQLRAMLLHNQFLAVRGFTGQADPHLLSQTLSSYETALALPGRFRNQAQVGYAALLAERGDRRGARAAFQQLTAKEEQSEALDLQVAYYYLALGERGRAIERLLEASRRETWTHSSATREGQMQRAQAYRMNDFDRLRDHPRYIELVVEPEER